MKKKIPSFRSKEEAALFWENHEVLDYIEPDEFKISKPGEERRYSFRNPRKKTAKRLVSLRIDAQLLGKAKRMAERKQAGYQSILRGWLEKGAA
ncbi:MAG: hypothetical protein HYU99_07900 [Deltaproteobacteria bacterium]|nr:hypothetical protein [Deltaproteobacteria bacterium]